MANKIPQKPDFVYDPLKDKGKQVPGAAISSDLAFATNPNGKSHISTDFSDLQKPPKPLWRRIMRVVLIILGVLALIAAAIALYLFIKAGKISTNPFDFSSKLKGEDEGRVNILLLGIGDPGHAGETLADTNMVVSINTKTNPHQVAMISLPRDLQVKIAGDGTGKLNEAHSYGENQKPPQGIETSLKTIEETLDIPIHYYARANFSGLKQAVDAVGGIEIDVKEPLIDSEYPCEKNESRSCGIRIAAGKQHMDGATALKYARCRKGTCGDDFGRALRQQEVLTATREKAMSLQTLSNPSKVNSLIEAASNNIKTDLSLRNIQRLQEITKDINATDITNVVFSLKPNGFLVSSKTSSDLLPAGGNFEDIQKFVANIFELGPIWKEDSTVTILNGTTTPGLGLKLQSYLENNGIPVVVSSVGNATTKDYAVSKIIDYTGGKKPNTASYFAKLLGVEVTQPATPVKFPAVDFEIILGTDYATKSTGTDSTVN